MTNSVDDLNFHAILTPISTHLQAIKSHSPKEAMFHKDCMINTVILTSKLQIHICATVGEEYEKNIYTSTQIQCSYCAIQTLKNI